MKRLFILALSIFLFSCADQFIVSAKLQNQSNKKDIVAAIVVVLQENGYSTEIANENIGIVNSTWKEKSKLLWVERTKMNFVFDEQNNTLKMTPFYQVHGDSGWGDDSLRDGTRDDFNKLISQIANKLNNNIQIKWVKRNN